MPQRSVLHVHNVLLEMIRQDFPKPAEALNGKSRGRDHEQGHVWEVRHAGLLGIKYEVAVRSDLVTSTKAEDGSVAASAPAGKAVLRGVVDAAVLGYAIFTIQSDVRRTDVAMSCSLGDRDDDVRSVAASCLLPVAAHLVEELPEELSRVLAVLWSCLSDMKDDLSSSVGAVMDLLGKLVTYESVIGILADENQSYVLRDSLRVRHY